MRIILSIFSSFVLMFSTVIYSYSNQYDGCINTLDNAFRAHYSIMTSSKDDEHPLSHNGIIESFESIKVGCNEQFYKMSVIAFGHVFFGNEISNNRLQKCVSDIYAVYSIFIFNDERTATLNSENGGDIKKELIKQFEESENCSLETKSKILEKIKERL